VRGLAGALAHAGHHVLRFDYTGVGESAGEFAEATASIWCDDIARALDELGALSGVREVQVVGLRLGATLAVRALASAARRRRGRTRVGRVVLWDPVLRGSEFFETADALHSAFVRDAHRFPRLNWVAGGAGPASGDDRLGYAFAPALRESLLALDLRDPQAWPSVPVQFVMSETSSEIDRLSEALRQSGRVVASVQVPGIDGRWADYALHEKTLRAGRVGRVVVDCLESV
jgi:uncharacterized protein